MPTIAAQESEQPGIRKDPLLDWGATGCLSYDRGVLDGRWNVDVATGGRQFPSE